MKRKLACALGVLLFWTALYALGSYGAARDVDPELLEMFNNEREIMRTNRNIIGSGVSSPQICMTFNGYGDLAQQFCTTTALAAGVVPTDFVLTRIEAVQYVATNGGVDYCTFTLLDSTLTAITQIDPMVVPVDAGNRWIVREFFPTEQFVLSEGDVLYMQVEDAGNTCNGAGSDPRVHLSIYGVPLRAER